MTSYFDEHNCTPLNDNETPNNDLLLARLLLDSGVANLLNVNFENLLGITPENGASSNGLPPPTSKEWLKNALETKIFDESKVVGHQCSICLKEYCHSTQDNTKTVLQLPCTHNFHIECVKLWLEQTSTCPACRYELPTDNEMYEELKRQRKRDKIRQKNIESLHDSMYM